MSYGGTLEGGTPPPPSSFPSVHTLNQLTTIIWRPKAQLLSAGSTVLSSSLHRHKGRLQDVLGSRSLLFINWGRLISPERPWRAQLKFDSLVMQMTLVICRHWFLVVFCDMVITALAFTAKMQKIFVWFMWLKHHLHYVSIWTKFCLVMGLSTKRWGQNRPNAD